MTPEELWDDAPNHQLTREQFIAAVTGMIDDEREACAVASETWTEGRSRFLTAADAIRARKPLK